MWREIKAFCVTDQRPIYVVTEAKNRETLLIEIKISQADFKLASIHTPLITASSNMICKISQK
jgi:hypothetical protein